MGLSMKPRDPIKFLEQNGYYFCLAEGGSHYIYSNGKNTIPIPIHGSNDFGEAFILTV